MRVLLTISAVFLSATLLGATAYAQSSLPYPVTIPSECIELAQREGVPTVLRNDGQTKRARAKLAQLNDSDPQVRYCRGAVGRVMARFGQ